MSDDDVSEIRVDITIDDTEIAARLEHGVRVPERHDRSVRIELVLPTGEGSEGPNLEGEEWEHALSTLIQRTVSAARFGMQGLEPDIKDSIAHLDRVVDAAHKRLDAIGAPDAPRFDVVDNLRRAAEGAAAAMHEANRGTVDDA